MKLFCLKLSLALVAATLVSSCATPPTTTTTTTTTSIGSSPAACIDSPGFPGSLNLVFLFRRSRGFFLLLLRAGGSCLGLDEFFLRLGRAALCGMLFLLGLFVFFHD